MLKWFWKGNNCIFKLCEQSTNVRCMYLEFRNLEESSKKNQEYAET